MNVAITLWDTRISPVCDAAKTLMIAEVSGRKVVERRILHTPVGQFERFVRLLEECRVDVLICGALCATPAHLLESRKISVISFLTGDAEEILRVFVQGKPLDRYAMPGCRWQGCCRARRDEEITTAGDGTLTS